MLAGKVTILLTFLTLTFFTIDGVHKDLRNWNLWGMSPIKYVKLLALDLEKGGKFSVPTWMILAASDWEYELGLSVELALCPDLER